MHNNNNRSMQSVKQQLGLEGILVTDSKGFQIHNQGFHHPHHVHALKQLSQYFFPNQQGTVVGIQTNDFTIVLKETEQGNLVATKEKKEQE